MKSICIVKDKGILLPNKYVRISNGKVQVVDERWITINADPDEPGHGQHILIKENGDIVAGLGGHFKNLKDLGKKKDSGVVISEDELVDYLNTQDGEIFHGIADKKFPIFGTDKKLTKSDIKNFKPVKRHEKQPTEKEIIDRLGGRDKTKGSCASLAMAYTAQKGGMDVLDFRGGESRDFFSRYSNGKAVLKEGFVKENIRSINGTVELLKEVEKAPINKEFILETGNHMAVVRNSGIDIEFLELQGPRTGWKSLGTFDDNAKTIKFMLKDRFKARTASSKLARYNKCRLYDCDKVRQSKRFQVALGFINTDEDKQEKGAGGGIK